MFCTVAPSQQSTCPCCLLVLLVWENELAAGIVVTGVGLPFITSQASSPCAPHSLVA